MLALDWAVLELNVISHNIKPYASLSHPGMCCQSKYKISETIFQTLDGLYSVAEKIIIQKEMEDGTKIHM